MSAAGSAITAAKMLWEASYSPGQLHDALKASPQASGRNTELLLHSYCEGSKTQVRPLASE
jgi:hypothetical protein